jgi:DNA-binding PadR family transcriptional regulator
MPKTFPVHLEIEEIALGTVLRKLNEMPGIAELKLDLGQGGMGAGRKQLEDAAKQSRGNNEQVIVKMLLKGPQTLVNITREIGGKKSSAYTVLSKLKKQGLVERAGEEKGTYQLTLQAKAQLGGTLALPAPEKSAKTPKVKHGPKGRAVPGSGNIVLRELLASGPKAPVELRNEMAGKGMSPKSISGVLDRARKASLIKKNGTGYELTAAGRKIEVPEVAANG